MSNQERQAVHGASEHIRLVKGFQREFDELRGELRKGQRSTARWKHRFVAVGIVALIISATAVVAISSSSTTHYGLGGEVIAYDTSVFTLASQGHSLAALSGAAAGTTDSFAGAVEMDAASAGAANTALTLGNWIYQIKIDEAGINTYAQSATAYYKVELFVDGASRGTVYVKNAAGNVLAAEGVTIKFDLGTSDLSASGASYVVKVSRQAA